MKSLLPPTASGPLLILTSHESLHDPKLLEELKHKGIGKFVAFDVPVSLARQRYGGHFQAVGTGQFQPAEILKLAGKDRDCNPAGEPDGYGMRNVTNERTQPQQPNQGQHESGEKNRKQQPFQAEFGNGCFDKNNERAGGTANLNAIRAV